MSDEFEDELEDDELEEELEDDDFDDDDDDRDGNRAGGARARAAVEHIARHLVDDPSGVFVDAKDRGGSVDLLVHASPGDLGRIIGRRGRVIQAVRQIARAAGSTEGVRVSVEVAE
ncbi:MAG: KH domain-containing protein [Actinomycetota bacterium]